MSVVKYFDSIRESCFEYLFGPVENSEPMVKTFLEDWDEKFCRTLKQKRVLSNTEAEALAEDLKIANRVLNADPQRWHTSLASLREEAKRSRMTDQENK